MLKNLTKTVKQNAKLYKKKNTGGNGSHQQTQNLLKNNEYAYEILVLTGAGAKKTQGKLLYIFLWFVTES
jgi:hypothetical protein